MRLRGVIVGSMLLTACNAVLGLEERPAREIGGGGASSGAGGESGCVGAACFEEAPEGWSGPVLFSRGAASGDVAECAPPFANELFAATGEPAITAHTCPCACAPATGITCAVSVTSWANPDCTGELAVDGFAGPGDCQEIDNDTEATSFPAPIVDTAGASCAASAAAPVFPDPTWGAFGRACGPIDDLDGALPTGFEACIFRAGDVPCPGGFYADRSLWYGDVDDTRACEDDCSCGAIIETECNVVMEANGGHSCNEAGPQPLPAAPGCVVGFFDSAKLLSVTPTGSCEPGEATATGELAPTDPTTVCCAR